ncbi:glycosyltransferase family 1 protein [Iodobacter sp.]|uniref:glycosyltransferase family 4 protein n=1 Tax=Iodobacter sp. TaxID=1915058 RepID=UPI0025F338DC|nr:glycosyltransferase family 1 protein [Iodobacter sp.]
MLVLFDFFELTPGKGKSIGINNYAINLLEALADRPDNICTFIVACNSSFDKTRMQNLQSKGVLFHTVKYNPSILARIFWNRLGAALLSRKMKINLYFSPKGFLPHGLSFLCKQASSLVVIHDLIPFWYKDRFPKYFGLMEELFILGGLEYSVKYSDSIVAISDFTAADIARRLGRKSGIETVYNGVPLTAADKNLYEGDYIFSVGSSLPHKNLETLLSAYSIYRSVTANPLPLVICGVSDPGVEGVLAVKGISDFQLHSYYAHAKLFIFLPHIEGFGFPPLEALSHHTPVLCSDIPVLREITKGLCTYVKPDCADSVALMIGSLLSDHNLEQDSIKISALLSEYSWRNCAEKISNIMQKMGGVK